MDKGFFNAIIVSAGREMFNWVPKAHLSSEYHTEEITPRSALGLHSWSYLHTVYHIQVSSYNPFSSAHTQESYGSSQICQITKT